MAEKFVPNLNAAAAGNVGSDGVRTVPLGGGSIDALRQGVQKMKELAPPTYTSKNIVAAYQAYMDELISGYKTIKNSEEVVEEPMRLLLDAMDQHEKSSFLPSHLSDVERYFVLLGNILLSKIVEGIECTMSFIRLSGKIENGKLINVHGAPYLEKYVGKSKPDTGLHVTEIMCELARYINGGEDKVPKCAPTDPPNLKADLLPVIYLNGTMVAYYSVASAQSSCVYYPFNTILSSNPNDSNSLFGVKSVTPNVDQKKLNTNGYYMWECNIFDFVNRFKTLSNEQQMLFLCSLESLKGTQIPDKAILAFHNVLQQKGITVNKSEIQKKTAKLISKPPKIVPFRDIPAGIQGTDEQLNFLTLPAKGFSFPALPDHFNDGTELQPSDYFEALASCELRAHAIKATNGKINIFVSMENNEPRPVDMNPGRDEDRPRIVEIPPFAFSINGQSVSSSEGVEFPETTKEVNVSVRYKDMIDLGVVQVSLGTGTPAEMSYDEATETLRYNYGTSTMQPMLSHYVRLENDRRKSDLLPITKQFAKMIVANGYSLKMDEEPLSKGEGDEKYTYAYTITIHVLKGTVEVCKPYISKTYYVEKREVLGELENMYVPEFSLYPFIKPVDQVGNLLWHQYILTGLHHTKESMTAFLDHSTMTALYKSTDDVKAVDDENGADEEKRQDEEQLHFFKQGALKKNYIARTARLPQIPLGFYMEHEKYKEIGYILIPEPTTWTCDTDNEAKLALDMGSRRSVINCQVGRNSYFDFYQRNSCVKRLTEIETGNEDAQKLMDFLRTLFLEGNHTGRSTFVSSVIQYDLEGNVSDEDKTAPFIGGRIVADMSPDFATILKELFRTDKGDRTSANALEDLGIFSDFKRKILDEAKYGDFSATQALFVKDAALHMALNALSHGCATMKYYFSTPTYASGKDLTTCWENVKDNYLNDLLGGCSIDTDSAQLEAVALYRYKFAALKKAGHFQYTILIDGGDSTFDVSFIEHPTHDIHGSLPRVKRNLSFRYAGQNILVDSIRDVCRNWKITKKELLLLWNISDKKDSVSRSDYEDLSGQIFGDSETTISDENWKGEYAKDIIYQLIEKLGLDSLCSVAAVKNKYAKSSDPNSGSNYKKIEHTTEYEVNRRGQHFWEMVLDIIRFKYLMLLRIIIQNIQDIISFSDEHVRNTVQVLLYGNTNHVAELVWPDGSHGIDLASMQQWMRDVILDIRTNATKLSLQETNSEDSYEELQKENCGRTIDFKVVSEIDADKKALVQGLVTDGEEIPDTKLQVTVDLDEFENRFDPSRQKEFMVSGFRQELEKEAEFYPKTPYDGNKNYQHIVKQIAMAADPQLFEMSNSGIGDIIRELGLEDQDVQDISMETLATLHIINLYLTGYTDQQCDYADATFFPKKK